MSKPNKLSNLIPLRAQKSVMIRYLFIQGIGGTKKQMFTRNKKDTENKKNTKSLLILLFVASFLFLIWLIMVFFLSFFYDEKKVNGNIFEESLPLTIFKSETIKKLFDFTNPQDNKDDSIRNVEKDLKTHTNDQDRDGFQPTMKTLFKDRDLTIKNIDEISKKIQSPKKIKNSHSTFGKEVVYIYHTHNRESFLPYLKDTIKAEEAYHETANITLVGEMLGRELERRGIGTEVDSSDIVKILASRELDYRSSYAVSRELVLSSLKENKDLALFLDVHRDSLNRDSTTINLNGENHARLLFVVGTGYESFENNLNFAKTLDQMLTGQYPGLSKGVIQKDGSSGDGVYNQDISPNSVIVEIGGVDNTVEELHRTTEIFAEAISNYYWHSEK